MSISRVLACKDVHYLEQKVTLCRLGAPLLFAYDACTFLRRLRGLHGVPPLGLTDALILRPCKAIHTAGLDAPIDIIFLDRHGIILKLVTLRPRQWTVCWRAALAVEMAAGTAQRIGLATGQQFVPSGGGWR
jgi:uncharacterized membrane protein (UPF0127 family)